MKTLQGRLLGRFWAHFLAEKSHFFYATAIYLNFWAKNHPKSVVVATQERGCKGYANFLNFKHKYFLKVARFREFRGLRRARLLCHFQRYPKGCKVAKVTPIS